MKKFVSLALVAVFAMTGFVGCGLLPTSELTYVTVDINPSFDLVVDDEEVVAITPLNADADVVVEAIGELPEGTTVEDALTAIVDTAVEEGYLTEENPNVTLTVVDGNESTTKTEKLYKKLEDVVKKEAEKVGRGFMKARREAKGIALELRQLQADPAYADNEAVQNLTPGQYRLICEVMENCDLTLEEALELDMKELIGKLKEARAAQKGMTSEAREKENRERKAKLKEDAKKEMEKFFEDFEDFLAGAKEVSAYRSIERILDRLEDCTEVEDAKLTAEEVAELGEILSLTEAQMQKIVRDAEIEVEDIFRLAERAENKAETMDALEDFLARVEARVESELAASEEVGALLAEIAALNLDTEGLAAAIQAKDLDAIEEILQTAITALHAELSARRPEAPAKR